MAIGRIKTTIKVFRSSWILEIKVLSRREISKLNLWRIWLKGVSSKYLLMDLNIEMSIFL
jgi:hypothetical protein